MNKQRGFSLTLLAYAVAAIVILGMIAAGARAIYVAGVDSEKAAQAERDRVAQAAARENDLKLREDAREASMRLIAANLEAREYETKWNRARNTLRETALAVCPDEPAKPGATAVAGGPRLRLTHGFLRLFDGAWTGDAGQPLFGDPGRPPEGAPAADTPSARGLDEALDVHGENARRASENYRQLNRLTETLKKLRADWR